MNLDSLEEAKQLLLQSCRDGSVATVQQLLAQHPDLGAQIDSLTDDDGGNSALIIASENGHSGIVKVLLDCGANVDQKNSSGWTALMKATLSEKGDSKLEIIDFLLRHGAQVDLQSSEGYTALMLAAKHGQTKIATKLVREYGDLKQNYLYPSWTALMEASESGCVDTVKVLLEHSANDLGWALVIAILNKHNDVVELLLKHGAQIDDENWNDVFALPPLVRAVEAGDADVVKLLLEHGAKQGLDWAMTNARFNNNAEIVKTLSECRAQVDNQREEPPLVEAVKKGDADIVKLLLEHGAKEGLGMAMRTAVFSKQAEIIQILSEHDPHVTESWRWSDVMEAVDKGDADIVKLLLEHGAKEGLDWAMNKAIFNKNSEIIKILSECGAQVDDDWPDEAPLVEAVEAGDADVVKLLLEHGAKDGLDMAMTMAIFNQQAKIMQILAEYGAQVDKILLSLSDTTPLMVAVEAGDADVVKLLLEHGARRELGWAMRTAIFSKQAEIMQILSEHYPNVDEGPVEEPPLVEAVEEGDADIVKLLLEHGARRELVLALSIAISSEQTENIQILSEYGADDWGYADEVYEPFLVTACKNGNLNVAKLLLEHGANEYRGWALAEAILNKHMDIVELLVERGVCGADRDKCYCFDFDLPPAIVEATESCDVDSLKLLLKYGKEEEYREELGWALSTATTPEIFSLLLDSGAKVDEIDDFTGTTPLVVASSKGNIEAVKLMLSRGAKRYLPDALVGAIVNKHTSIMKLLTQHGAQVDDESWFDFRYEKPAIVRQSKWGDVEAVKQLLEQGAEKYLDWAMEIASKRGNVDLMTLLYDYGIRVDNCDIFDTAALVGASRNGKTDAVRFLLEQGLINRLGLALRAASGEGHIDIVLLLFEYGNADDGGYALIEASRSGHTLVITFLIERDVFVDFQDEEQTTALIVAAQTGHVDSVNLLVECGAEVNLQNSRGTSALMAASQASHIDVIKSLLKFGADINLRDENDQTAAELANNDDIIALFASISDDKFDKGGTILHEETQEEKAHLIAIENAIKETGTLDHTLLHGVFVGPPRSGKDSLLRRLLGELAPSISPSTGAAETTIHVKVEESCTYAATIGLSNWTRLAYDEEALHLMKTASNNSSTSQLEEESTIVHVVEPPSAVEDSTPGPDVTDIAHQKTVHIQTDSGFNSQPEIDPQRSEFQDDSGLQVAKIDQNYGKSKHKTPMEIFKEAIRKKGLEGLRKQLTNSWSLYLTNTGGQMEFQELLPLLVSGPSTFFITFQLHKNLNECFQVEYELPSGESSKCYQSSLSILDSILQTLSTIAAMGTFVYKGLQKKCVPLKPKVFLIGTHKDLLDKKSAETIINNIDAQLQAVIKSTSHYREGLIQFASKSRMIFTVSNLDPSDSDFQIIRSAVEKTVERGDYKMRSPAHWMIYSLVVRQLKTRVESYDECFAIAKECGIRDKNEFNEALHFIHTKMGLVRYFPHGDLKDLVIVDPQILFEKVTELIVETFTFENLCNPSKLEAFENMGIFNLSDFTKISSRTGQNLTPTLFAKLLEYLRIAAQFQQGGETKYILPCVLTHAQVKQNVHDSRIPPVVVTFQCGYCPKGLFGTLISYLINNEMQSDFEWELVTEKIYRDEVCFEVGPYDTVTIRFLPTHLEITCVESNSDLPRIKCTEENICQEVIESVEKGIKTVTSAINYISAQHSYTFYCTSESCGKELAHPAKLKKFKGKLCSLRCDKLSKCFPLPSGHETWQLDSSSTLSEPSAPQHATESDTRLKQRHIAILYNQLNGHASKWKKIGIYLGFLNDELDVIAAKPSLYHEGSEGFLREMLSNWLEWAPGDQRGSEQFATLEALKRAVSSAGLGATADRLTITCAVTAADSATSHSASVPAVKSGNKRHENSMDEPNPKRPRLN